MTLSPAAAAASLQLDAGLLGRTRASDGGLGVGVAACKGLAAYEVRVWGEGAGCVFGRRHGLATPWVRVLEIRHPSPAHGPSTD